MDAWLGRPVQGNDVVLTIDDGVQRAAIESIDGYRGACIVLDPRTGAVLASASNPAYDPNNVEDGWETLSADCGPAPLIDRTRSALYPPGSTFKVVTLTAALGTDTSTLDRTYPGPGSHRDRQRARHQLRRRHATTSITLADATARSVNTVYGQVAVELGPQRLVKQAEAFGFNNDVPYELPATTSLMPDPAEMTEWETAWAGIGQPVGEHESPPGPQSTVMQMAQVSAGIANAGHVMRPYVVERITDPAGPHVGHDRSRGWTTATDPATAATVRDADGLRRRERLRRRARSIDGVQVAGKTGTAEVGKDRETTAWFIAFAPADDPTVAMAIMLEEGGVGGRVAAPRARTVLEAALASQGSQ